MSLETLPSYKKLFGDRGFAVASKTPGLPPVIDVRTALNLINIDVATIS